MQLQLINNHTHFSNSTSNSTKDQSIKVYSFDLNESLPKEIVNDLGENSFYTLGIHPWEINESTNIDNLLSCIQKHSQNSRFIALGEIGLDRIYSDTFDLQYKVLDKILDLVSKNLPDLPIVFHVVKAYSDILSLIKKHRLKNNIIFHDFNGNKEIINELIKYNSYFSLGSQLFNPNSKLYKNLQEIPAKKILIETDDQKIFNINDVYKALIELRPQLDFNLLNDNFLICYQSRLTKIDFCL